MLIKLHRGTDDNSVSVVVQTLFAEGRNMF